MLVYLTSLRAGSIQLRAVFKLSRAEVLGNLAHSTLDEIPVKAQRMSTRVHSAQRYVDVRMFGVVVGNSDPLQWTAAQLPLDPTHHLASEPLQIDLLAEFWRDDELP